MDSTDKIIAKIKKLLIRGNDPSSAEAEREVAMRMAHALLAKHNLDMAEVEAAGGTTENRGVLSATFFGRPWARQVASSIAKLFFCKYVYYSIPGSKQAKHMFIGKESNSRTAAEIAAYVVQSILSEGKSTARGRGNLWVRSFGLGAGLAVGIRVERMIREATEMKFKADPNAGTALVLSNLYVMEAKKNEIVIANEFPKLHKGHRGSSAISAEAAIKGQAYGASIEFQKGLK